MELKILEELKLIFNRNKDSKIALNNLEMIINYGEKKPLLGQDLFYLLRQMESEGLVISQNNGWIYSITQKGLKFLEKNLKVSNFKVTLKNKTISNRFCIHLIYQPKGKEEVSFRFENSSKGIERSDLDFLDENLILINPVSVKIINPIKREKLKVIISKDSPFIYELIGEIKYLNTKVHIELPSVAYVLEKGKKYYLQLRYQDEVSERIELLF